MTGQILVGWWGELSKAPLGWGQAPVGSVPGLQPLVLCIGECSIPGRAVPH